MVRSIAFLAFTLLALSSSRAQDLDPQLVDRIEPLVRQLNDVEADRRNEAEQALVEMAPTHDVAANDKFLLALPKPQEGMPEEVRLRLTRIRRQIETKQANQALAASKITLSAQEMEIADVFEQIEKQTGNRLVDYRKQFGQDTQVRRITIEIADEPFWPAIDKILDESVMSLYPYSGEKALAAIDRELTTVSRVGLAAYAGPFRIEAVNVVAQLGLRSIKRQSASIELEIAWEPRLRPIALSQPIESLEVVADDGSKIALASPQASLDVEVQPGTHATELNIPLVLPPRSVSTIATFKGELSALVPGRSVEFRFDDLEAAKGVEKQQGGVKVVLDGVRKNQELWEIHMRLKVESEEAGLESHRGWVFQNTTYLLNKNDEIVDHAGFETTLQSEREVGLAYFFELPDDDLSQYTWVYQTPAAIVRVPVKYELKDIPLP